MSETKPAERMLVALLTDLVNESTRPLVERLSALEAKRPKHDTLLHGTWACDAEACADEIYSTPWSVMTYPRLAAIIRKHAKPAPEVVVTRDDWKAASRHVLGRDSVWSDDAFDKAVAFVNKRLKERKA